MRVVKKRGLPVKRKNIEGVLMLIRAGASIGRKREIKVFCTNKSPNKSAKVKLIQITNGGITENRKDGGGARGRRN
jgi:hypothetical protein